MKSTGAKILLLTLVIVLVVGTLVYFSDKGKQADQRVATYPTLPQPDQGLVEMTNASSSAPTGFHTLRDIQLNVTFNIPLDWKSQVLPEGDGRPSLISPDLSLSSTPMTGAYVHYSYDTTPDGFPGGAEAYMASLKQGMTWTQTSLDGHTAYISSNQYGFTSILSQFSDSMFVTIAFEDPGGKYGSVLKEFLRSFHAL